MTGDVVLAVDGGNSKTDLALVRGDGELLALVRGAMSSPQHLGIEGSLNVLERLLDKAVKEAGLARNGAVATRFAPFGSMQVASTLCWPTEEVDGIVAVAVKFPWSRCSVPFTPGR